MLCVRTDCRSQWLIEKDIYVYNIINSLSRGLIDLLGGSLYCVPGQHDNDLLFNDLLLEKTATTGTYKVTPVAWQHNKSVRYLLHTYEENWFLSGSGS